MILTFATDVSWLSGKKKSHPVLQACSARFPCKCGPRPLRAADSAARPRRPRLRWVFSRGPFQLGFRPWAVFCQIRPFLFSCHSKSDFGGENRGTIFFPSNAVKCPLGTSTKDGLARRLSPCNCVPIESMAARSPWTQRRTCGTKLNLAFYHAQKLPKP